MSIGLFAYIIAGFIDRKNFNLTNLFYIYKETNIEKTVNEVISEKEPSLREFRTWIKDISDNLLKKNLIIVFDNMDRLPKDKVQKLWSSIHTFFSEHCYNKIWVIVPFDRAHIENAFDEKDGITSNHFINKTFSVVFNVSPPILSDWKEFFNNKFIEAFGTTEDIEYDIVKNIFDIYNDIITPRKIISFINDLVSLKLIRGEEIKLRYCAIFVVNKARIIIDPIHEIVE